METVSHMKRSFSAKDLFSRGIPFLSAKTYQFKKIQNSDSETERQSKLGN